jgi:hypothetical protein
MCAISPAGMQLWLAWRRHMAGCCDLVLRHLVLLGCCFLLLHRCRLLRLLPKLLLLHRLQGIGMALRL